MSLSKILKSGRNAFCELLHRPDLKTKVMSQHPWRMDKLSCSVYKEQCNAQCKLLSAESLPHKFCDCGIATHQILQVLGLGSLTCMRSCWPPKYQLHPSRQGCSHCMTSGFLCCAAYPLREDTATPERQGLVLQQQAENDQQLSASTMPSDSKDPAMIYQLGLI